jgi:Spermidine/putrescine-binding periplasmic protein
MMMKNRFLPFCSIALVISSVFAASMASAANNDDGIVVYNAQHENLTKSWVDEFTKETGIKVTLRNGGDTELGNQMFRR